MVSKKVMRWGGIAMSIVGVLFLLQVAGIYTWLPAGASVLNAASQPVGMSITSSMRNYPVFADIAAGGTYQWQATVTNTGISWDSLEVTVRVLKTTSTVCTTTAEWIVGSFKAGQCAGVTCDGLACRENIESAPPNGWDMQYSPDAGATWYDINQGPNADEKSGDQVYDYNYKDTVPSGGSRTFRFRLTPPTGTAGTFPVVLNAIAEVGKGTQAGVYYIVASKQDSITVGGVDGTLAFSFIGGAMTVLGAIGYFLGRKP